MDNAQESPKYAEQSAHPAGPRLRRTDPRKPLWQMSHEEKISRAVEHGMIDRQSAEQALSTKDAGVVFNSLRGLGTALLMGDRRWRPQANGQMGTSPGATSLNPQAQIGPQTRSPFQNRPF